MRVRRYSRRSLLGLAAGSAAGLLAGCSDKPPGILASAPAPQETPAGLRTPQLAADGAGSTPAAAATPAPASPLEPFPPGRESRTCLAGTPWETALVAAHSGVEGPTVMILGGVHGNEPGGWFAADELAGLTPAKGSLVVLPRANQVAIRDFVRTHDDLGDLNRLYPGNPESALPMERLAAEIVAAAREYRVDLLLDLHESWAFYSTRSQNGTAFLGQTITAGVGPRNPGFVAELVERVNPLIGRERDRMVFRDGSAFRRADPAPGVTSMRGRSSLSLGGHVPGVTPILVEMGQEDQAIERRTELHLLVATEALRMLGLL